MLRHLPDGTLLLTRLVRADDKRLLERGLANLSETSVQRRFLSPKPRFSGSELRYLTELDGVNHLALVAERPTQPARGIIGVARYVRLPEDPQAAEVAIVVADNGRDVAWAACWRRSWGAGPAGTASPASPPRWARTTCPPTG